MQIKADDYLNKSFDASNAFFSLQMDSIRLLEEVFGEKVWENEFYFIKDGYAKIFIPKEDLAKIRNLFEKRIKDNPEFFNDLYKNIELKINKFKDNYSVYLDEIDQKTTVGDLRGWIKSFHKDAQETTGYAYITDGIGLDFEAWMPYLPISKDEFTEFIHPLKNSFTKDFEYNLAKLKLDDKRNINDFVREYSWVENSYTSVDRLTLKTLEQRLDLMSNEEADVIIKKYKGEDLGLSHESLLRDKNFDSFQLAIALSLCRAIDLQDSRKEIVFRTNSILQKAYNKLFNFYGYSPDEMDDVLKGAYYGWIVELSAEELLKQSKNALTGFTWFVNGDTYFGESAISVLPKEKSNFNNNEIKGFSASKGQVKGKVVTVLNEADHKKNMDGCILVTTMTRPEMIQIMQKASAFVTDDGGITCHAAIVARELGKPCIIGTKNATKILKDGDFVEVDADNGIVRIIKNEK